MQKKNPVEKLEKVEAPKNASEHLLNLLKATLSTILSYPPKFGH